MIVRVIENIGMSATFIFVIRKEHDDDYGLSEMLSSVVPDARFVRVNHLTDGAACSTLLALEYINNNDALLIANSDQLVEWSPEAFLNYLRTHDADGGILTFEANDPKWSYVAEDVNGLATRIAEKEPISPRATVGIYYYHLGFEYVFYARRMISKNIRVNGEFYVAPVFNEYILDGKKVMTFPCDRMFGMGTPEDLHSNFG